jgi:hypothetical protein
MFLSLYDEKPFLRAIGSDAILGELCKGEIVFILDNPRVLEYVNLIHPRFGVCYCLFSESFKQLL